MGTSVDDARVARREQRVKVMIVTLMLTVLAIVSAKNAWLSDDAYITFRTIDNFVNGHGLRWNVLERVQSYTHPMWMFVITFIYFFTREVVYSVILLSITLTLASATVMSRLAASRSNLFVFFTALISSKAFVDYSTSGLENPMSFILLASFYLVFFREPAKPKALLILSLIASLAMFNRMDTILFYGFPLLYVAYIAKRDEGFSYIKCMAHITAGFIPFIAWTLFSILYYGFPFPNTAYAKLATGIDPISMARQGILYVMESLKTDHVTLVIIGLTFGLAAVYRQWKQTLALIGVALYIAYTVRVGGDFMSGRFFALPLLACAGLLVQMRLKPVAGYGIACAVLLLGLMSSQSTLLYDPEYHPAPIDDLGITDERGWYGPWTGFLGSPDGRRIEDHPWAQDGLKARKLGPHIDMTNTIGYFGFHAGPEVYVLDFLGLSDPLLARMEIADKEDWRIGHFERLIPTGYIESIQSGKNQLKDPNLHEYYDKILLITRGDIWGVQRFIEIIKLNAGVYDHLIAEAQQGDLFLSVAE